MAGKPFSDLLMNQSWQLGVGEAKWKDVVHYEDKSIAEYTHRAIGTLENSAGTDTTGYGFSIQESCGSGLKCNRQDVPMRFMPCW